jgi:predicted nucleic acid-binding protein
MIILDTNVISEAMRLSPSPAVLVWLAGRPTFEFATTTINVAEVRFGLARLPYSRHRTEREALFDNFLARSFEGRVFGFDGLAADTYGELVAARERCGHPLPGFDGLIAAIAAARGFALATRDVSDFAGCGLSLINPWDAGEP